MTDKPLRYPNDRTDGYVLLEVNGLHFVPRFTRCDTHAQPFQNYKEHWNAWQTLLKRRFGKQFEPSNYKNLDRVYL
jgi:hypothetical protein